MLAEESYRASPPAKTPDEVGRGSADTERVRAMALKTLTARGSLRLDAARLIESPLLKEGRPCGVHFMLVGPRRLLLTAIWDTDRHELWCYDSRGTRFSTVPTA